MIFYVTGNNNKFAVAKQFLDPLNIDIEQKPLELVEIQSHSIEDIAVDKAKQAFNILNAPLFVNDHGWSISALGGFPGAYMKYINEWLTPTDFLNLMKDHTDRTAILTEVICYIDANGTNIFQQEHRGTVLEKAYSEGEIGMSLISLTSDGISIAEKIKINPSAVDVYPIWEEFADWLKNNK